MVIHGKTVSAATEVAALQFCWQPNGLEHRNCCKEGREGGGNRKITFIEKLQCAKHCAKCLTYNIHNNLMGDF